MRIFPRNATEAEKLRQQVAFDRIAAAIQTQSQESAEPPEAGSQDLAPMRWWKRVMRWWES